MKQGELEDAVRRALNMFDAWNDVAGVLEKDTGYYYEIQGVITEAVKIGAQAGSGNYTPPVTVEPLHFPELVYMDQSNGDDGNIGITKDRAFATIRRAVERSSLEAEIVMLTDLLHQPPVKISCAGIDFGNRSIIFDMADVPKTTTITEEFIGDGEANSWVLCRLPCSIPKVKIEGKKCDDVLLNWNQIKLPFIPFAGDVIKATYDAKE